MKGNLISEGTSAKAGLIVGTARVIKSKSDLTATQPGEILIGDKFAPEDDDYLKMASVLIENVGGPTAHSMIFVSDKPIMAIVGTMVNGVDITSAVHTGQKLVIDGEIGFNTKGWRTGGIYEYVEGGDEIVKPAASQLASQSAAEKMAALKKKLGVT